MSLPPSPSPSLSVAVLHAAEDAEAIAALTAHLIPLCRGRRITIWHRGLVPAGTEADAEVRRHIEGAAIILLIVSSHLEAHCEQEIQLALAQTERGARVIPIYYRPVDLTHTAYGARQRLPRGDAITQCTNADQAWVEVAEGLRAIVESLPDSATAGGLRRLRLAIVAVQDELGEIASAVARRLSSLAALEGLEVLDAAAEGSLERARAAAIVLVLVGSRTGGTGVLAALLEGDAIAFRPANFDPTRIRSAELAGGLALWSRPDIAGTFTTAEEAATQAADRVAERLAQCLRSEPGSTPVLEPWERQYLEASFRRWELGNEGGLRARAEASGGFVTRARLYVSLRAEATPTLYSDAAGHLVVRPEHEERLRVPGEGAPPDPRDEERGAPYLEALLSHPALPHLVIEGEAGAGKTVLLQHVAYVLSARHLGPPAPVDHLDLTALTVGAPLLRVPLLIEAKNLAPVLPQGTALELIEHLGREIAGRTGGTALPEGAVREGLRRGRYLLLVDSLDEVASQEGRGRVLAALANLVGLGWPLRLVLTTRPAAHLGLAAAARGLRRVRLALLDDEAVGALVGRWAETRGAPLEYRESLLEALGKLVERHGDERGGLRENPLLLTAAMWVYDQQHGTLPDSPAELYERMVQLLCDARPTPDVSARDRRLALEHVLLGIQETGTTARPLRQAAEHLRELRGDLQALASLETVDELMAFIERLGAETGLVRFEEGQSARGRPEVLVRPWHRSFQEFLAACKLASGSASVTDKTERLLVARSGRPAVAEAPEWEGVLVFLVGVYWQRGSDLVRAYLGRLFARACDRGEARPARPGRLLGLCARGLAEYPAVLEEDGLREEIRREAARAFAAEGAAWPLADRLLVLEALGRLGDPRLEEEDPWVEIEGGAFLFGDGESYGSPPPRREQVGPFHLCWHPVTVAEYARFVDAQGYADVELWAAGGYGEWPQPGEWHAQRYHPTRPVVGVSWYEAMAYCRFASRVLGLWIDLPTEIEWEFVARGAAGRVYPWGNEEPSAGEAAHANHWGSEGPVVGLPSPVGAFPAGHLGRIVDLAGNVWEWCRDPFTKDARPAVEHQVPAGAPRLVRGGSWINVPWDLRAAYRDRDPPRGRRDDLGFRVVCRGPR